MANNNESSEAKFAVFADLHIDIMHDSLYRLNTFLYAATEQKVDFIVSLGDITYPDNDFMIPETGDSNLKRNPKAFVCNRDSEKREAIKMLETCGIPVYHVLGNHDMDICTKEQTLKYLGCTKPFYSFDVGKYHFIVLDCNYIYKNGEYISYEHCNYHESPPESLPYLPDDQLAWIESDIMSSPNQSIIFSHQSLSDMQWGIRNKEQIWQMFKRVNADKKRVVLCMNGHSHVDGITERDGIYYVDVNSMANIWLGRQYSCIRYNEEIDKDYPYIKYTAPYRDPLYAIVTLDEKCIDIQGIESEFIGPSPYELNFPEDRTSFKASPIISNYRIPL